MTVDWANLAIYSYEEEEVLFILRKWNMEEAEKFSILVFEFIETLKKGIIQGRAADFSSTYFYVI